jgi:hypothetical protein
MKHLEIKLVLVTLKRTVRYDDNLHHPHKHFNKILKNWIETSHMHDPICPGGIRTVSIKTVTSTGPKTEEGRQWQHIANWKHGMRSKAAIEENRQMREFIRQWKQSL